jgi:tetratricopeptide repeat protein 30
LSQEDFGFLENFILYQTSQEEAYRKFEDLSSKHIDTLRKKTKAIQDARLARDSKAINLALQEYD